MGTHELMGMYSSQFVSMVSGMGERSSGSEGVGVLDPSLAVSSPKVTRTEPAAWRPHVPGCMVRESERS